MIVDAWQLAATPPDLCQLPPEPGQLDWQQLSGALPVAAARPGITNAELDGHDWWYRASIEAADVDRIVLASVATVADVYLDGRQVAHSESMFRPIEVSMAADGARHELAVCCRALTPRLAQRRKPRARWRTKLVADGNLRFHRTMLLGRAPGFAPGPAAVGLCAPVRLLRAGPTDGLSLRTRIEGDVGVLTVHGGSSLPAGAEVVASGPTGSHRFGLAGELRIPRVARWWPHTHGEPNLYAVTVAGRSAGHVGFRTLTWPTDWQERGFGLTVNGVDVFCRGAVWTPVSLAAPHAAPEQIAQRLGLMVDAGMNMVRIPGTATYESDAFHDICDRLGILVWQDMMFANLDYPDTDPEFVAEVEAEAGFQLGRLAGRPSLAVVCGGSECAQQVTMLGLDPELARGPLYTAILPGALADSGADAAYIPNSPWGGEIPFRPDTGVSNYYGVGAYLRDLCDAELDHVGFAAECLAFSNVGDRADLSKQGIPRDAGAGWDFEDVRDHYLRRLYGVDPVGTRWADADRYLDLSRGVTGEVMAEALQIWRRPASSTRGALLLWLADVDPGSGWGILDEQGFPKAAYHRVAQALAPRAVWLTDEGLRGMDVHVANDGADPLAATLRLALYRDGEVQVGAAEVPIALPAHGYVRHAIEELIGHFVDVNWAYRFGPPNQDLVVAALEADGALISQAVAFPVGRPLLPRAPGELGLAATLDQDTHDRATLGLTARRVVHGLRIQADGWRPSQDFLSLEPGRHRTVALTRSAEDGELRVRLTALNLAGSLRVLAT